MPGIDYRNGTTTLWCVAIHATLTPQSHTLSSLAIQAICLWAHTHKPNKKTYPIENPLWKRLNLASYNFFLLKKKVFFIVFCYVVASQTISLYYNQYTRVDNIVCRCWAHERTTLEQRNSITSFHHIYFIINVQNLLVLFFTIFIIGCCLFSSFLVPFRMKTHNVWSILIISFESTFCECALRTSEMLSDGCCRCYYCVTNLIYTAAAHRNILFVFVSRCCPFQLSEKLKS